MTKSEKRGRPFEIIDYRIVQGGDNPKEIKFSLDDTEEQMMLRRMRNDRHFLEYYHRFQSGILPALRDLVQVNWLSIHRMSPQEQNRDERSFDSSIDQKLGLFRNTFSCP